MTAEALPITADVAKVRAGIDLVREATVMLRTTRFKGSPDGRMILGLLNDAHIAFAESQVLTGALPLGKLKATRKGGLT